MNNPSPRIAAFLSKVHSLYGSDIQQECISILNHKVADFDDIAVLGEALENVDKLAFTESQKLNSSPFNSITLGEKG